MSRDETRFSPNVGSLYSFVEVENWTVTATRCTFTQKGGITSSYNWSFTGYSQLQWGENGTWHDTGSEKSGTYSGYGDKVYDSTTDYFNRQSADRTVYVANYAHAYVNGQSTSARAYIQFTVPALPPDATTLTATRNSDTSVSLAWTGASGVKESVRIERSTDGAAYSEIASVSGSATSYTDSTTSADHTYTYRVRYYNVNAYGAYSATASVTMAPSAPTSISLERTDATDVSVTLTNVSSVATSVEWQESLDGGSTWGASTTVNGSPVTSFTATTSGGTVTLRVRNVNSVGSSEWIVSEPIVTITPPNPPTLVSPSGVFNMSAGSVTFTWLHNPKDGSAQTAAELQYSTNGGSTWTTVTLTTAQSYTLTPIPWTAGTTVTWRARTKGADANYGDWASSKQFTCYQVPSLTFAASNPPSTITALPIPIQVTYSDPQSMACAAASVSIQKDGRTLYTEPLTINGNTLSGSITAAEFLPENGESYTVVVTARSGSSLQATANMTVTVDYVAPTLGDLGITNDAETGYVSLIATYDNAGSDVTYNGNTNAAISVTSQAIKSLTVDGKAVQDGTPTPSSPVPIQVVQGAEWNQLVHKFTSETSATNGFTVTSNADGSYTVSGTSASNKWLSAIISANMRSATDALVSGHKYLLSASGDIASFPQIGISAKGWQTGSKNEIIITTTTAYNADYFQVQIPAGTYTDAKFHPAIVDLTSMFGAGNEPATVDAFKATGIYKAKEALGELYDYDAGSELFGINVTHNGTTTVTPIDLQGNVLASLPDGTKDVLTVDSAGHVGIEKNTATKDMGDMSWTKHNTYGFYSYTLSSVIKNPPNNNAIGGVMTLMKKASTWNQLAQGGTSTNYIAVGSGYVGVADDTGYSTSGEFKTAMSGVPLYYGLATPSTVDLGTITLPAIADGDTVEIIASLSTPVQLVGYDGSADADSITVIRVNADGTRTALLENGESGAGIVDKYAPLNTPYTYEVVTYASSGAYAVNPIANTLNTTRWFAYWGDNIAWAKWNPSGSYSITRPEKKRVHYAGRKWPVSYDSKAIEQSHSMSWQVVDMEDWENGFKQLMADGGRGVYKGCDGWVFHADFDYNAQPNYTSITRIGKLGLTITRIDGEQL